MMSTVNDINQIKNHLFLIETRLSNIDATEQTFQKKLSDVNSELGKKIDSTTFYMEQNIINEKLKKVKVIEHTIPTLALKVDLEKLSDSHSETSKFLKQLNHELEISYYRTEQVDSLLRQQEILNDSTFMKISTFNDSSSESFDKFKVLERKIDRVKDDLSKDRTILQNVTQKLNEKVDKAIVLELERNIEKCVTIDELEIYTANYDREIKNLQDGIADACLKVQEHREAMARFDEIITEKASKITLDSFLQQMNQKLGTKLNTKIFDEYLSKHYKTVTPLNSKRKR